MNEMTAEPVTAALDKAIEEPLHVGQKLARQRQALGIEVAKAAAHLRISARQIEAIEAGRWSEFPSPAILRGFVRAYAKFVQCPLDHLLEQLPKVEAAPDALAYKPSVSLALPEFGQSLAKRRSWRSVVLIAVLVLGLAAVTMSFSQGWQTLRSHFSQFELAGLIYKKPNAAPAKAAAANTKTAATSQAQSAPAVVNTELPSPTITSENTNAPEVVPLMTQAPVIVLSFAQEAWVEILQSDNSVLARGLQPAGSRLQLAGKAPFYLLLGNAGQVQLSYQGSPVDLTRYINTNNQVARLTLK